MNERKRQALRNASKALGLAVADLRAAANAVERSLGETAASRSTRSTLKLVETMRGDADRYETHARQYWLDAGGE
jgi:hypothetical protein